MRLNLLCWPVVLQSSQSRSTVKAFSVLAVVINWLTFAAVINVIIIIIVVWSSWRVVARCRWCLVVCAHCMTAISLTLTSTSLTLWLILFRLCSVHSGLITVDTAVFIWALHHSTAATYGVRFSSSLSGIETGWDSTKAATLPVTTVVVRMWLVVISADIRWPLQETFLFSVFVSENSSLRCDFACFLVDYYAWSWQ